MANEIEKVNTIEITDIEKIMGKDDDDIEKLSGFEFAGVTFPAWANSRAVVAGGTQTAHADLTRIQYKTVGATANTVNFGGLQSLRSQHQCAGSNQTRGIFGGGSGRSGGSQIYGVSDTDYITVASTGDGSDFGDMDLQSAYGGKCGASNGTLLFSAGGYSATASGNIDQMEYYTIASTGNGTDAGNLSGSKSSPNSTNGDTRYIVSGGYSGGNVDIMEYNDFSTSANVTDFGDLSSGSNNNANACSTLRAVIHAPVIGSNVLEYVTVASTGNSNDFGDLNTGRDALSGTSDGTTGEFFGGNDGSTTDEIDIITIGTTGNGTDVGDLMESNQESGALSGI